MKAWLFLLMVWFAGVAHAQQNADQDDREEPAPVEQEAEDVPDLGEGEDTAETVGQAFTGGVLREDPRTGAMWFFQVRPVVALGLHTPRNAMGPVRTNLVLGVNARVNFELPGTIGLWSSAYSGFVGMTGSKRSGWEWRSGAVAGPSFAWGKGDGRLALVPYTGIEFLLDRYRFYCRPYGTAFQFSLPLMLRLQLSVVWVEGGVAPSWFISTRSRDPVDFSVADVKGFGDEFELRLAGGLKIQNFRIGLFLRTRVASYGDQTWIGLGFGYYGAGNAPDVKSTRRRRAPPAEEDEDDTITP